MPSHLILRHTHIPYHSIIYSIVKTVGHGDVKRLGALADDAQARALAIVARRDGSERVATLRREMAKSMEDGCGIYRTAETMRATCDKLAELKQRYKNVRLDDQSKAWNTDWLLAIELGFLLDVAQAMAHSALSRKESRGSHQRLDGHEQRDDVNYLQHSLANYAGDDSPRIDYGPVKITTSQPGTRAYGAAGEQAEADRKAKEGQHV